MIVGDKIRRSDDGRKFVVRMVNLKSPHSVFQAEPIDGGFYWWAGPIRHAELIGFEIIS